MNRTLMYERHLEQIKQARDKAVDAGTAARAFDDYADMLRSSPTMGAIPDKAKDMMVTYAVQCAADCKKAIDFYTRQADQMERDGMPDA